MIAKIIQEPNRVCFSIFILLLLVTMDVYSQNIPLNQKKAYFDSHKKTLEDTVNKRTFVEYAYVVGRYHEPVNNKYNHPYLEKNEWVNGTLFYNGQTYAVEGLKYDIESNTLIYLMYTRDYKLNCVALDENLIGEFNIYNTTFRHFKDLKNFLGLNRKEGYYEVVYDGDLKFLVYREKTSSINNNSSQREYSVTSKMFLVRENNKAIKVHSMLKLRLLLKHNKKDMRAYIGKNNLKLNRSNYTSAYKILKYYESLNK